MYNRTNVKNFPGLEEINSYTETLPFSQQFCDKKPRHQRDTSAAHPLLATGVIRTHTAHTNKSIFNYTSTSGGNCK